MTDTPTQVEALIQRGVGALTQAQIRMKLRVDAANERNSETVGIGLLLASEVTSACELGLRAIAALTVERDDGVKLYELTRQVSSENYAKLTALEAENVKLRTFCESVRDTAVGKDDALDVCVDLMKAANRVLCELPDSPRPVEG